MTLEAIYFVGQTVAAFAIVGSLIFVGLQTWQASKGRFPTTTGAIAPGDGFL